MPRIRRLSWKRKRKSGGGWRGRNGNKRLHDVCKSFAKGKKKIEQGVLLRRHAYWKKNNGRETRKLDSERRNTSGRLRRNGREKKKNVKEKRKFDKEWKNFDARRLRTRNVGEKHDRESLWKRSRGK